MRNIKKRTIIITLIFVTWLIVIFSFSAMNSISSSSLTDVVIGFINNLREKIPVLDYIFSRLTENHSLFYVVRKLAHMFVFCMLEIIAFWLLKSMGLSLFKSTIFSILAVFLYACTDEFHQLFVSGRSGQMSDVMIDTLGGCIGLSISLIIFSIKSTIKKILKNKKIS